jgi:hypothetical protein
MIHRVSSPQEEEEIFNKAMEFLGEEKTVYFASDTMVMLKRTWLEKYRKSKWWSPEDEEEISGPRSGPSSIVLTSVVIPKLEGKIVFVIEGSALWNNLIKAFGNDSDCFFVTNGNDSEGELKS